MYVALVYMANKFEKLGNSIAIKFFNSSWRVSSTVVAGAVNKNK
jgi:hypothetical protein